MRFGCAFAASRTATISSDLVTDVEAFVALMDAVTQGDFLAKQPTPSDLEIVKDYMAQNPTVGEMMSADQALRLFHDLEQHFWQPARA